MSFGPLRFPVVLPFLVATMGLTAWWGCSGTVSSEFGETGSGGGSSKSAASGNSSGGAGGGSTGALHSSSGAIMVPDGGESDSTCVATEAEAQLIPLDMVILLDRSGSMGGTKWDGATGGLKTFVNDPASAGINVGILYFPNDVPYDCNYLHYQSAAVDVGPLPANALMLVSSIDAEDPNGIGAPTYGGLKGTLFVATALQDANPDHKVIVVLVSDGEPIGCPDNQNSIPAIAALAESALNYNGVQTYVIAIQGSNLDPIAAAGGTTKAYEGTTNVQTFSQKMAEIRAAARPCELIIPPPPMNQALDPDLVNVNYTPGGVGISKKIPKADSANDCGSNPGWYYDNPSKPTKIILCPASCQTIQADPEAAVNVAFGCKSD